MSIIEFVCMYSMYACLLYTYIKTTVKSKSFFYQYLLLSIKSARSNQTEVQKKTTTDL